MKKMVVLLLCLLLLPCTFAEEVFSFRNGVQWGMDKAAVYACEGMDIADPDVDIDVEVVSAAEMICLHDCRVSNYEGSLCYLFRDDRLYAAMYFMRSADFGYLIDALESKYGPMQEADTAALRELEVRLMGDPDGIQESLLDGLSWAGVSAKLDDGTMIFLMITGVEGIALLYMDVPGVEGLSAYNTYGL